MSVEPGLIPQKGYAYVIAAAILWAVSGTSGKFLFNQGVTPLQLVQLRVTLSAAFLFLLLIAKPGLLKISPGDILYFAVLGISGLAMVMFSYFYAISKINVAVAILLEYLAPVFIAVYYSFFAPEKLTRITLLAIMLSVSGCCLAVGIHNVNVLALNRRGIAAGVLSGLAYAWYAIYGERGMRRYDPWTVVFYAFLFASLFWNIALEPFGAFRVRYTGVQWFWVIYIVVFGTAVPYCLYTTGISLVRSTRASVAATVEPIAAAFISWIFLGEHLDLLQITGGALVIASVIILQLRREYDDTTSSLIRQKAESC
ncbi:MAG: DMT family transporter [Syntrophobacteraceae bacterium]